MTTSDHMHNDLQFENDIKDFPTPTQFVSRQIRAIIFELGPMNSRLEAIEDECKKRGERCRIYIASGQDQGQGPDEYGGDSSNECCPSSPPPARKGWKLKKDMVGGGVAGATIAGALYMTIRAICAHFRIII